MRSDFVGSFYFKQTTTGNLLGEFINNDSTIINVESAVLTSIKGAFIGTYDSIWNDGTLHSAKLEITKVHNKFIVEWTDVSSYNYEGQAMIVDNILTGYYRVKP